MSDKEENPHPNWRALASVSFHRKVFIKANEETSEKAKKNQQVQKRQLQGTEAKAFYQSVLDSEPEVHQKVKRPKKIPKEQKVSQFNFRQNDLFKAAQNDDIDFVTKALKSKPEILNFKDEFGWTLLMISSKAGSEKVVKHLVKLKANQEISDKSGRNCVKLAKNQDIRDILKGPKMAEIQPKKIENRNFKCELCKVEKMTKSEHKIHQSSTVHQFKMESEKNPDEKKVHYVIPEANQGFQMMLKSGWKSNKGLGPKSSGKLYPVKTVLKNDRKGVGHPNEKNEKKVTHFAPFDASSVAKKAREERQSTLSKRVQDRKKNREKQKEIELRRELF